MQKPGQTLRSTPAPVGVCQAGNDLPIVAPPAVPATAAATALAGGEAVRAVDGLVAPWLERHAGLVAAGGARRREHLALLTTVTAAAAIAAAGAVPAAATAAACFSCRPALRAARRLVREAL